MYNKVDLDSRKEKAERCFNTIRNNIKQCFQRYMSLSEIEEYLARNFQIEPEITRLTWGCFEEHNAAFFRWYFVAQGVAAQVRSFNSQVDMMQQRRMLDGHAPLPNRNAAAPGAGAALRVNEAEQSESREEVSSVPQMPNTNASQHQIHQWFQKQMQVLNLLQQQVPQQLLLMMPDLPVPNQGLLMQMQPQAPQLPQRLGLDTYPSGPNAAPTTLDEDPFAAAAFRPQTPQLPQRLGLDTYPSGPSAAPTTLYEDPFAAAAFRPQAPQLPQRLGLDTYPSGPNAAPTTLDEDPFVAAAFRGSGGLSSVPVQQIGRGQNQGMQTQVPNQQNQVPQPDGVLSLNIQITDEFLALLDGVIAQARQGQVHNQQNQVPHPGEDVASNAEVAPSDNPEEVSSVPQVPNEDALQLESHTNAGQVTNQATQTQVLPNQQQQQPQLQDDDSSTNLQGQAKRPQDVVNPNQQQLQLQDDESGTDEQEQQQQAKRPQDVIHPNQQQLQLQDDESGTNEQEQHQQAKRRKM